MHLEGLVPADLLEGVVAAVGPGLALERLGQPRRRILLHDARGALGADHALVERMIGVALDVADLAIAQGDADTAAAGAHVTGGVLDLDAAVAVGGFVQRIMEGLGRMHGDVGPLASYRAAYFIKLVGLSQIRKSERSIKYYDILI
jgi:hypothetical protein